MHTLIVLTGPTGVGKTKLSLRLAEFLACPILNADSRQIYKGIPIGTAAPTQEELDRVKHYFVGELDLDDYYSAARFEQEALQVLAEHFKNHEVAVLSGGSMLYIDALCKGIDDVPTIDEHTRELLASRYEKVGLSPLLEELERLDPIHYEKVDRQNVRRVIHALEVCYVSGKPYSSFLTNKVAERPFRIIKIGLNRPREELFERINLRVTQMMESGLMEEVERVFPLRHLNALNTVGYKELFKVVEGEWDLSFALDRMRKNTRVYAKKQLTWFKRDEAFTWFNPDEEELIIQFIVQKLSAKE